MKIKRYDETRDYDKILELFKSEKDWECYTKESAIKRYKESLNILIE